MFRSFQVISLVVLLLLVGLFSPLPAKSADYPNQFRRFLPENPDIIIAFSSLEEFASTWNEFSTLVQAVAEPDSQLIPPLEELLQMGGPYFSEAIDHQRPLGLAVNFQVMPTGPGVTYSVVVPVREHDVDLKGLSLVLGLPTVIQERGYVLFSSELEFVPSSTPLDLLDHMPDGSISMAADLRKLWRSFSPLLDYGLMALSSAPPPTEGQAGPGEPNMSPEQVDAMGNIFRSFFGSVDVLSFGLNIKDGHVFFTEKLEMLPGSPLAPPNQPDFNEALELTKILEPDSDLALAYAVDPGELVSLYQDFYRETLKLEHQALGDDTDLDLDKMMDSYFQAMDMARVPTALAINFDQQKFTAQYVLSSQDTQSLLDFLNLFAEQIEGAIPWLQVQPVTGLEIAGRPVTAWDFHWDIATLMAMSAAEGNDPASDKDIVATKAIVESLMPGVRMCKKGDLLFVNLGRDLDPLAAMIEKSKQRRSGVHPGLAKLSHQGGTDTQAVFEGDLGTILAVVFEIAEEYSGEDLPALGLGKIPFTYVLKMSNNGYAGQGRFGLEGFADFVHALKELDGPE